MSEQDPYERRLGRLDDIEMFIGGNVEGFLDDLREECAASGIKATVPEVLWLVLCEIEDFLHEHKEDGPLFLAEVAANRFEFRGEVKAAAAMRADLDQVMRDHFKK